MFTATRLLRLWQPVLLSVLALVLLGPSLSVCPAAPADKEDPKGESVEKLLAMLKDTNPKHQIQAMDKLQELGLAAEKSREVVPLLIDCMEGKDIFVAKHAAQALPGWITPESANVPRLLKLVDSKDPFIRTGAIVSLGHLKEKQAIKAIGEHLGTDNRAAVRALAEIGSDAESVVGPHLKNKSPEVFQECCRLLKMIGTKKSVPALEALLNDKSDAVVALARGAIRTIKEREDNGGKPLTDATFTRLPRSPLKFDAKSDDKLERGLANILANKDGRATYAALDMLEEMTPVDERRADVVEVLLRGMEGMDGTLAGYSADVLPAWVTPGCVSIYRIINLVDLHNGHARGGAILALGRLKDPRGLVPLVERMPVEWGIVGKALRDFGPGAEKAVLPYLKHKRAEVIGETCRVLKAIGTRESLTELQSLLDDRNGFTVAHARTAIRTIKLREANGGKLPDDPNYTASTAKPDDKATDELSKELTTIRGKNSANRIFALDRLAKMTPVKERQAEVVAVLFDCIEEGHPTVSPHAGKALPTWVTPETQSIYRLTYHLDQAAGEIRVGVLQSIAKLKDKRAAEAVADWFPPTLGHASQALIAIGPESEKFVIPYLKHRDKAVVGAAIGVLKEIGTSASVKDLEASVLSQEARAAVAAIKMREAKRNP